MPVAAPLIGGAATIAGAALSKPKTQKQEDPYAYLRPYMSNAAQTAQAQFQQGGPQLYNGPTIADQGGTTLNALDNQLNRAQLGSPVIDQAQNFVTQGLSSPIESQFGQAQNPYSQAVGTGGPVSAMGGANPYASPVNSGAGSNPYASGANPFGGTSNPYLDQQFQHEAQQTQNQLTSEYARAGRNIDASAPARGEMLNSLAAKIYAPAYENERNRQLSYGQQQLGIGATGFENSQDRGLQSGLAAQNIGANSYENLANRSLTSGLQNQNLSTQAALQGQQIGAQGFENAQSRQLSDLTSQRGLQQNLLGYAPGLANQDYIDIAAQRDVGAQQDQRSQALLTDKISQYNQTQSQPYQNFQNYLNQLSQLSGGTGQTPQATQTPGTDYLSAGVGGALLGSTLFPQQQPNYGYGDLQQQQLEWLQTQQQPVKGLF